MNKHNTPEIIFTEDQIDVLKEFMNIALGQATASLADILDAFGTMHIPKISVRKASELPTVVEENLDEDATYYVTKQLFASSFGGECIFVMDTDSAKNLGNHLFEKDESSADDISDAVLELTNIITSTIISRLTGELNTQVQFFAPSTQLLNRSFIVENDDLSLYSTIIVVSTVLEFKEKNIYGSIFILTKDETILSLQTLIDQKLEELYA